MAKKHDEETGAYTPYYIKWFDEIRLEDVPLVGGKNASLGELYRELTPLGVLVPPGFCITAQAYNDLLDQNDIRERLEELLEGVTKSDLGHLSRCGREARRLVFEAVLPESLKEQILQAYHQLRHKHGEGLTVAVRSSATAEDLPHASFAGQQETYLNVSGDEMLLEMCRRCFASLFTDRAISYRIDQGFNHMDVALSIGIQKMVRADIGTSGVMFSLDTETGFRDAVLITASYGLGENVVQGAVDPDEFYVHKPTFNAGYRAVLRKSLGRKQIRMVYASDRTRAGVRNIPTAQEDRERYCLTDNEVLILAEYAIKVEQHYSERAGKPMPMDMEWARDGLDGGLYLVQARPETVAIHEEASSYTEYKLKESGTALVQGRAVGRSITTGKVRVFHDLTELESFRSGEVLVADMTTPDWEPVMKLASAIITNRGGRTCHAAIVARELGIPAVVGTAHATTSLSMGQPVTVSCAQGEVGQVYEGKLDYSVEKVDLGTLPRPKTGIMLNVADPEAAFRVAGLPNDGVGLARMEFIINHSIGVHPLALLYPYKLNEADHARIKEITRHYRQPTDFFIHRMAEGVGTIAAAFYPRPVIVRLSDFKSNEYASLLGGKVFEPAEANPMIGFRGAARYLHPDFKPAFALECEALKYVRNSMGLTNMRIMVPFCRTVDEARAIIDLLQENGLSRKEDGEGGLQIYMMCEIPNNVVQIDEFARYFDGFSIGSNDLTQLVLGVDRDSEYLAAEFDERNPGVLEMMRQTIEGARRNNRYCGICGQAPSDFPEVAEFVVRAGIDSISLNPDSVIQTTREVLKIEAS